MNWLKRPGIAVVLGFAFGALLLVNGCSNTPPEVWPSGKSGPKVLTSFVPIQCFALNVAGDDAVVKVILSSEGAHHGGDPSPLHLKLAAQADVLFFVGLGLDDKIASKVKASASNPRLSLVALGNSIDQKSLLEGECHHQHKPGEVHDHGTDPHVWLSPKHARTMVAAIRDELKRIDPAHAGGYDSRAAAFIAKLEQLEKDGLAMLKDKKDRKILTHHDSLQYFSKDFGLEIVSFIQTSEVEPGQEELKQILDLAKKNAVRVIAVEPQFSRNSAASVIKSALQADKIDAEFVEVDTLEAADEADLTPDYYERKMRQNLENLAKALR
jgi:zinc transport system substrate-binding protein